MSLFLIHLTDIHIQSETDQILNRAASLANACAKQIDNGSDIMLLISGDLAYSGTKEQYKLCEKFITELCVALQTGIPNATISVFAVPGNHDCDFSQGGKVRTVLLESVDYRASDGFDAEIVESISLSTQSAFFQTSDENHWGMSTDNYLQAVHTVNSGIGQIVVVLYNTAWMSTLNEAAGHLCMPVNLLHKVELLASDMVIALFHHPMWWLHPDNKLAFERQLRESADLILCGHEHNRDEIKQVGGNWNFQQFEGKELQAWPRATSSSFTMYQVHEGFNDITVFEYEWEQNHYRCIKHKQVEFSRNRATAKKILYPNKEMLSILHDTGVILHHPQVDDLSLADIYVWPNIDLLSGGEKDVAVKIAEERIYDELISSQVAMVYGPESSGKTSLAKQLYLYSLGRGKCALLCSGRDFTARKEAGIYRDIEKVFIEQYSEEGLDEFRSLEKSERILVFDNFELLTYNKDSMITLLCVLKDYFSSIIILTYPDNRMPEFLIRSKILDVKAFKIRSFGYTKRMELIEKWYALGIERSNMRAEELDAVITQAAETINDLLGNMSRLMPSNPITLLSILQVLDNSGTTVINANSMAYERLVNYCLDRMAEGAQERYSIYRTVLSVLAYRLLTYKRWSVSSEELLTIVADYAKKALVSVDVLHIIDKLVKSKILLCVDHNKYQFKYPYLYYYFCGMYISSNLHEKDVYQWLVYMSERLHVVEYGSILTFAFHFAPNKEILHELLINAMCTLDEVAAFGFHKTVPLLDDVANDIKKMLDQAIAGSEDDVIETRKRVLAFKDAQLQQEDAECLHPKDCIPDEEPEASMPAEIIKAFRIIDVISHTLKNYPGNFLGDIKMEAVDAIKDLSMRVVGMMYDFIETSKDEIIHALIQTMQEHEPDISGVELETRIRQLFNSIVFSLSYSMIQKVGVSLASNQMLPVLKEMAAKKPEDIPLALILQNAAMLCASSPDADSIIGLSKQLHSNKCMYAQETLRLLVLSHLKQRKCGEIVRDRLCSEFSLKKSELRPALLTP